MYSLKVFIYMYFFIDAANNNGSASVAEHNRTYGIIIELKWNLPKPLAKTDQHLLRGGNH